MLYGWGALVLCLGVGLGVFHSGVFAGWGAEGLPGLPGSRQHRHERLSHARRHQVFCERSPGCGRPFAAEALGLESSSALATRSAPALRSELVNPGLRLLESLTDLARLGSRRIVPTLGDAHSHGKLAPVGDAALKLIDIGGRWAFASRRQPRHLFAKSRGFFASTNSFGEWRLGPALVRDRSERTPRAGPLGPVGLWGRGGGAPFGIRHL